MGSKLTLEFQTPEDDKREPFRTAVFERALSSDGTGFLILKEICGEVADQGTKIWSHESDLKIYDVSTQPKTALPPAPKVSKVIKRGETQNGQDTWGLDTGAKVWAGESGGQVDQGTKIWDDVSNDVSIPDTKIWADTKGTDRGTKIWEDEHNETADRTCTQWMPASPAMKNPATDLNELFGSDFQKQAPPAPSTPPLTASTIHAPRTNKHASRTNSQTFALGVKVSKLSFFLYHP